MYCIRWNKKWYIADYEHGHTDRSPTQFSCYARKFRSIKLAENHIEKIRKKKPGVIFTVEPLPAL